MCCQGDGADSCRAAPLGQQRPAGHGGLGKHRGGRALLCPRSSAACSQRDSWWHGGLGRISSHCSFRHVLLFFFFFSRPAWHARANDDRKTQQGRAKHKGSDRPSRDRQGQRVTPGLTQGGLTPSRGFSTCRELHGYKQLGFLLEGSWESPPGMLGARRGEVGAPWGAAKPGACNKSSSCQKIPTENNHLSVD